MKNYILFAFITFSLPVLLITALQTELCLSIGKSISEN